MAKEVPAESLKDGAKRILDYSDSRNRRDAEKLTKKYHTQHAPSENWPTAGNNTEARRAEKPQTKTDREIDAAEEGRSK
jgi:hypothetical protein